MVSGPPLPSVNVVTPSLDVSVILPPFLWQGGCPPPGDTLARQGWKSLVLCAEEWTNAGLYQDIEVLCAPNQDNGLLTQKQWERARSAARWVARRIEQNQKVLVTCMAGLNRSGLVTALVLHERMGWCGARCVSHVKQARDEFALTNPAFVNALLSLK